MHACGHDGHTAMLLATLNALHARRDGLTGEIRFIFQHAEELLPGGARQLVEAGVMDGVDLVVGAHLFSLDALGKVGVLCGPHTAAADLFAIEIRGKGGHGRRRTRRSIRSPPPLRSSAGSSTSCHAWSIRSSAPSSP